LIQLLINNPNINDIKFIDLKISLIGFVFISAICCINSERSNLRRHLDTLEGKINDFYTSKANLKQPYKIYFPLKDLMNIELNKFLFSRISSNKTYISNIHCYTISEESIILVNGTKFLWENTLINNGIIQDLRKNNGVLYNYPINNVEGFNIILLSKSNNYEYIYVIKLSSNLNFIYKRVNFFIVYKSVFQKLSDLLNNERQLFSIRKGEISELSEKRKYVNYAIKSMHFIRNRLTPFNNLTELLSHFFNNKFNDDHDRATTLNFIKSESNNCKTELHHLVKRANYILENNRNPFGKTLSENVSIIDIYTSVGRNFNYFFPGKVIQAKIVESEIYKNYHLEMNKEGFEIFISDWLNNCQKYSKGYIQCDLELSNEFLKITFVNNYNLKEQDVKSLVKDLNSDSKKEILKRSTNGVFLIKEFLGSMDIDHFAKIDTIRLDGKRTSVLVFSVSIKLIQNEDSNI